MRTLRERVRARNQDLTREEAEARADRFAHERIDDLARDGTPRFERDYG